MMKSKLLAGAKGAMVAYRDYAPMFYRNDSMLKENVLVINKCR